MRYTMRSRVGLFLLAVFAAWPANAQGNANAAVCAADDDSALSPEQRIAACTAVIKAARNTPKEVADAAPLDADLLRISSNASFRRLHHLIYRYRLRWVDSKASSQAIVTSIKRHEDRHHRRRPNRWDSRSSLHRAWSPSVYRQLPRTRDSVRLNPRDRCDPCLSHRSCT